MKREQKSIILAGALGVSIGSLPFPIYNIIKELYNISLFTDKIKQLALAQALFKDPLFSICLATVASCSITGITTLSILLKRAAGTFLENNNLVEKAPNVGLAEETALRSHSSQLAPITSDQSLGPRKEEPEALTPNEKAPLAKSTSPAVNVGAIPPPPPPPPAPKLANTYIRSTNTAQKPASSVKATNNSNSNDDLMAAIAKGVTLRPVPAKAVKEIVPGSTNPSGDIQAELKARLALRAKPEAKAAGTENPKSVMDAPPPCPIAEEIAKKELPSDLVNRLRRRRGAMNCSDDEDETEKHQPQNDTEVPTASRHHVPSIIDNDTNNISDISASEPKGNATAIPPPSSLPQPSIASAKGENSLKHISSIKRATELPAPPDKGDFLAQIQKGITLRKTLEGSPQAPSLDEKEKSEQKNFLLIAFEAKEAKGRLRESSPKEEIEKENKNAEPGNGDWNDEDFPTHTQASLLGQNNRIQAVTAKTVEAKPLAASAEGKLPVIKEEATVQSGASLGHSRGAEKTAVMPIVPVTNAETSDSRTFTLKEDVGAPSRVKDMAKRFSTPQAVLPISRRSTSSKRSQGEAPLTPPSSPPATELSRPRPAIAAKPQIVRVQ